MAIWARKALGETKKSKGKERKRRRAVKCEKPIVPVRVRLWIPNGPFSRFPSLPFFSPSKLSQWKSHWLCIAPCIHSLKPHNASHVESPAGCQATIRIATLRADKCARSQAPPTTPPAQRNPLRLSSLCACWLRLTLCILCKNAFAISRHCPTLNLPISRVSLPPSRRRVTAARVPSALPKRV